MTDAIDSWDSEIVRNSSTDELGRIIEFIPYSGGHNDGFLVLVADGSFIRWPVSNCRAVNIAETAEETEQPGESEEAPKLTAREKRALAAAAAAPAPDPA